MLDPVEVAEGVKNHFDSVTTEEFVAGVVRYNPDLALTLSAGDLWQRALAAEQRLPKAALTLHATVVQFAKAPIDTLVVLLLERHGFTVSPVMNGSQNPEADLIVYTDAAARLRSNQDSGVPLLVFELKSFVGVEVRHTPAPEIRFAYRTAADIEENAASVLLPARRLAEQHAMALGTGVNLVGERIRFFRELQGLSHQQLAERVPGATSDQIARLEAVPDEMSNPDLLLLRRLATALSTSVAQLVEPTPMDLSVVRLPGAQHAA